MNQRYLKGKEVTNVDELDDALSACISLARAERRPCMVCFNDFAKKDLTSSCGRHGYVFAEDP